MAPCKSANCKRREEELLANQVEQRRLLVSHVVTHAAKVATANTDLLKGILETGGIEGMVAPDQIPMMVISTLKAEVDAKKRAIAQSKANLQQRERMFTHPLNNNRSMMSEEELQKLRGVHHRLEVVEGRRVKELEREIVRVALGREIEGADGDEPSEDQEGFAATAEELVRTSPNTEDEEVSTDTEMESSADEVTPEEGAIHNHGVDNPNKEVQSLEKVVDMNREAVNMQSQSRPTGNIISDEVEETGEEEVIEVGAEVLGDSEDELSAVLAGTETIPIPTQTLQMVNVVESPAALLCKDCSKTFSKAELLLAHAMTEHWVRGTRRQHCPLKGCNYVGGIVKLNSHVKEKHASCARNCGTNILKRQDWPQLHSKSIIGLSAARQAAEAGTLRTGNPRPSNSTRRQAAKDETAKVVTFCGDRGGRASASSVRSKVVKKMGTRSCIAVSKGNQVVEGMKGRNKAVTVIWRRDGDSSGVTTRSSQAKERMKLRSRLK